MIPQDHPEYKCQECGERNTIWYAENELFNKVNGSPYGIICPNCFLDKSEKLGMNLIFKVEICE